MSLRLLTLAPSTTHPPMIGDAKRIYRLARGFWQNGLENTYVGRSLSSRPMSRLSFSGTAGSGSQSDMERHQGMAASRAL